MMEQLNLRPFARVAGPISAAPVVADLDGDGHREIIVVADAIYVWRSDGSRLPGFPVRGRNAFASRPVVVDVNRDNVPEIVVGCDDNAVYVLDGKGQLLPGWPVWTGRDVYSSPAVLDLDGDGRVEVIVGSDDGHVYIWKEDGTLFPGWPQPTRGFVAASPQVVDVDRDGEPEVVVGSWDGYVYIWRLDGTLQSGWPQATGHFVWASPCVADVDGDGQLEIVAASDQVYIWRHDGTLLTGWPQPTWGYNVASPLVLDWDGDGRNEVIQVGGALHAWRADGTALPGFPVDLSAFVWAPPVPVPGIQGTELVVAGWDGKVWAVNCQGRKRLVAVLAGPVFASMAVWSPEWGVIGDWTGRVYWLAWNRLASRASSDGERAFWPVMDVRNEGLRPDQIGEGIAPFVRFPRVAAQGILWYRATRERCWHPVPMVWDRGGLVGLIQPFLGATEVTVWAQVWDRTPEGRLPLPGRCYERTPPVIQGVRLPPEGSWTYRVCARKWGRVQRWWRRWRAGSLWARRLT